MDAIVIIVAILCLVGFFALLGLLASMFRKVGPNQALIVYGFGGTEIVQG